MWLLPTRGRPDECRALIAAMRAVDDVPPVAVMIDDDRATYADVAWPLHWTVHHAPEHLEMTRAVNLLVGLHPGESFYGFFGDHFRPLTKWSAPLEAAAADWLIAWPSDGDASARQPSGALTFGGRLVAALGWICLPATVHVCTDRVWWHLWRQLGIVRHVEGVRFTRSWPVGQGQVPRQFQGRDYNAADFAAWRAWERDAAPATLARLRIAMIADGYEFAGTSLHERHGATPFQPGW